MQLTGPKLLGPDRINGTVASFVPAVDAVRSPDVGAGPDPRPARAAARAAGLGVGRRRGRRGRHVADRAGLCPSRRPARAARPLPRPGRRPPAGRRARRHAVGHRGPPGRARAEPPRRPGQPAPGLRRRRRPRPGARAAARRPGGLGDPAPTRRPVGPRPGLNPKGPAWGGALPTLRDAGRQRTEGPSCSCSLRKRPHVRGLRALGPVGDLELDGLALVEGLVAVALDGREVDEDVVAAVAGDEAVALLVAEPLDGAFRQRASLLSTPAASTPVAEACRPGRADCTATPTWAQAQVKPVKSSAWPAF